MVERNDPLRVAPFKIIIAIAISLAAPAQAKEVPAREPSSATEPAEVRIVSTEFKYAPAEVVVPSGRAATLVLDNNGAETEHSISVPALGFRLEAKAGETTRTTAVFNKPGEYEFSCDLPGHSEAGMKGKLIVSGSWSKKENSDASRP